MSQHRHLLVLENDLNRVFSQSLGSVAAAELAAVTTGLLSPDLRPTDIEITTLGRATALAFRSGGEAEALVRLLASLSASALLLRKDYAGGSAGFEVVPLAESLVHGTELVTVQRYRGKTNERLTRAMVNLALAGAGIPLSGPRDRVPVLLDPMCGRGTTLGWALCYGLHAIGIDADAASLRHHDTFVTTWAKRHRLPHKRQSHKAKNAEQRVLTMEVAATRTDQKAGRGQRVETFAADGGDPALAIKRRSVDVIVADLPYGVQHRADSADPADTAQLIERMAPTWHHWLRPGGTVCLAWNARRSSRDDLAAALQAAGFAPVDFLEGDPQRRSRFSMEHRVDSTITRDVLVMRAR